MKNYKLADSDVLDRYNALKNGQKFESDMEKEVGDTESRCTKCESGTMHFRQEFNTEVCSVCGGIK